MKPIIKYRGGKSKEIPHIMKYVPRFSGRYIEPFLGGGAMFFHLEPHEAIINDVNVKLMSFYQGVRDNYGELRQELDEIEQVYTQNRTEFESLKSQCHTSHIEDKNEALYYLFRDMYNGHKSALYSDAAIYYFINKTAYSGMIRYNSHGDFNVPYGRYKSINTKLITTYHHSLLQRAQLFCGDYSSIFEISNPNDFMFLDPPYDCIFSDYGNEEYKDGFSEAEHRRLAQDFKNVSCKTLMIIGKTPLTEELYQGFIVDEYNKSYSVNIRNRFKSEAKHIVVANYDKEKENENLRLYRFEALETTQPFLFDTETKYGKDR